MHVRTRFFLHTPKRPYLHTQTTSAPKSDNQIWHKGRGYPLVVCCSQAAHRNIPRSEAPNGWSAAQ